MNLSVFYAQILGRDGVTGSVGNPALLPPVYVCGKRYHKTDLRNVVGYDEVGNQVLVPVGSGRYLGLIDTYVFLLASSLVVPHIAL